MPLYEYQCRADGHRFEVRHGVNDDPVTVCPECGAEVRRVIHPVGIVFKGSGFYATDSKRGTAKKPAASDGKSGDSKASDNKTGETKSESKPEPASGGKSESNSGSAAAT